MISARSASSAITRWRRVDDDADKRKREDGRDGLQDGKGPQRDFRMRGLEDIPGDCAAFIPLPNMDARFASKTNRSPLFLEARCHGIF